MIVASSMMLKSRKNPSQGKSAPTIQQAIADVGTRVLTGTWILSLVLTQQLLVLKRVQWKRLELVQLITMML